VARNSAKTEKAAQAAFFYGLQVWAEDVG